MKLVPDVRALLAAIDSGHRPPPELLARLRNAVEVKRRGRPSACVEVLVRGSRIDRMIREGTPRHEAINAVAGIHPGNGDGLQPCSPRTAERHLDEFRSDWIPMLRQWLVLAERLILSPKDIAAIASAAEKLNPRVTPTIRSELLA